MELVDVATNEKMTGGNRPASRHGKEAWLNLYIAWSYIAWSKNLVERESYGVSACRVALHARPRHRREKRPGAASGNPLAAPWWERIKIGSGVIVFPPFFNVNSRQHLEQNRRTVRLSDLGRSRAGGRSGRSAAVSRPRGLSLQQINIASPVVIGYCEEQARVARINDSSIASQVSWWKPNSDVRAIRLE